MKALKILTTAAAAAIIITAAASAETINTIEKIEETALLNNLEYKSAVLEVMKAENALESWIMLDNSSVGLSSGYSRQTPSFLSGLLWEASASLPVFEQLSLSTAINQDLTRTLSVQLSPLAHSDSTEQTSLTYSTKIAAAEDIAREVANTAVKNYLDWAAAAADYDVSRRISDVKKLLYEDEKIRYEKDESTLDDVRDAFTAWSESRKDMNNALSKFQSAETELYTTLNIDPADNNISSPVEADLFNLIETLKTEISNSALSISGNYDILNAQNAAESLRLKLDNTWMFEPDLQFSGSLSAPQGETASISATALVSIGLDDWNAGEREELKTELAISRQIAVQTINTEQLNLKQAQTTAETAAINFDVAEVELTQAEELLDEAEFLYGLGEYSAAELEETNLLHEQSKNGLFTAAAEHYTALRSLLDYAE